MAALAPCAVMHEGRREEGGMLGGGLLPALNDEEGVCVPADAPPVIDAHVHLFPDRMFAAIWRWFDTHGWPIRYQLKTPEVIEFLLERGVEQIVALHYAHKPGLARGMNQYMANVVREQPRVRGLATVFPGEPDAVGIIEEAFEAGLHGVKLHCHVQCMSPNDPRLFDVYKLCEPVDAPVVIHAGREPKSPAYSCDPHEICSADRLKDVLDRFGNLRVCVPHFGADEFDAYARMVTSCDNLWLDTTMMVADYFPVPEPLELLQVRPDRLMYGTDFPGLPFAWDRELKHILGSALTKEQLKMVLADTARGFFGLDSPAVAGAPDRA